MDVIKKPEFDKRIQLVRNGVHAFLHLTDTKLEEILPDAKKEWPRRNDPKYDMGGGVYDALACNRDRERWARKWLCVDDELVVVDEK